jgi:hypothetical protein
MSTSPADDGTFAKLANAGQGAQALDALAKLPADGQAAAVTALGASGRAKLASSLKGGKLTPSEKTSAKAVFDATPDGEIQTLCLLVAARFNKHVGAESQDGSAWDAAGLRQIWGVLETLPPAAVENNPKFSELLRYKDSDANQTHGFYQDSSNEIAMSYGGQQLNRGLKADVKQGDQLYDVNEFNEAARHEVGHAVDAKYGFSKSYCTSPAGGGWHDYGSTGNLTPIVTAMVTASGGAIGTLSGTDKSAVITALAGVMRDGAPEAIDARIDKAVSAAAAASAKQDPAVAALRQAFSKDKPWDNAEDGGQSVGGKIFHEAYTGNWISYDQKARARRVSLYQFRAPGEWFAEAYAAYYEPVAQGQPKGQKLAAVDPQTKAYFDKVVDAAK